MDEKILLATFGVAVGWLLNTVSAYSKYRFEYKTHSGKALAYLLVILGQLEQINHDLEKWKDHVISWNEFEVLRAYKMHKHFLAADELSQNVEKAFIELAAYDPIFAEYLLSLKGALAFHRSIKMDEIVKDKKIYIQALSSWETVLIATELALKKNALRLARQHGLLTWFKMKRSINRNKKAISTPKFSDELFESYKTLRNTHQSTASNKESNSVNEVTSHTP